jgi:hypothetical protein
MIQISTARTNPFSEQQLAELRKAADLLRDLVMKKGAADPA